MSDELDRAIAVIAEHCVNKACDQQALQQLAEQAHWEIVHTALALWRTRKATQCTQRIDLHT
jgi:hypothetical protein